MQNGSIKWTNIRIYIPLDVPKKYKTSDGYSLGTWIMTQRGYTPEISLDG